MVIFHSYVNYIPLKMVEHLWSFPCQCFSAWSLIPLDLPFYIRYPLFLGADLIQLPGRYPAICPWSCGISRARWISNDYPHEENPWQIFLSFTWNFPWNFPWKFPWNFRYKLKQKSPIKDGWNSIGPPSLHLPRPLSLNSNDVRQWSLWGTLGYPSPWVNLH